MPKSCGQSQTLRGLWGLLQVGVREERWGSGLLGVGHVGSVVVRGESVVVRMQSQLL